MNKIPTRYFKLDNFAFKKGEELETKVDGKIKKLPADMAYEIASLGDEITKEEYDNL